MAKAGEEADGQAMVAFVTRSGGAERTNYTSFLAELCGVLSLEPTQQAEVRSGAGDIALERCEGESPT